MSVLKRMLPLLVVASALAPAAAGPEVYDAMGLDKGQILAGTQLMGKVVPGEEKQVVCLATYLTGKREKSEAVNVMLAVLSEKGEALEPIFSSDYGASYGGLVGDGNLQLIDLDRDGVNEIVVSFDSYEDPLIDQQLAEVILYEDSGFRVGWAGPMEYDATKAARTVPVERRDRFRREIDLPNTLRTRGVTLFFKKTMIAVAGERLSEPQIVEETFPLRPRPNFR
jgi:hypothetical protein